MLRQLTLALVFLGTLHAQDAAVFVEVTGAVKQPLKLGIDDLAKMPRASAKTTSNGVQTDYQGVWLHEVLKRAGAPQGEELRGKALAGYVLAQAQDGYQVVFSLGELDPAFVDHGILLADTANDKTLSSAQDRFRLVVPKDTRASRSVRMLTRLEVVQLRK